MTEIIIFKTEDENGVEGVALVHQVPGFVIEYQDGVDADGVPTFGTRPGTLQDVIALSVPEGAEYAVVEIASPLDYTFRNAWRYVGGLIEIDMTAAREIHRARMRIARAPLLAALDIAYMQALERGDAAAQATIAAQKDALRDVTENPAIDAATTPDALKAVWPSILEG